MAIADWLSQPNQRDSEGDNFSTAVFKINLWLAYLSLEHMYFYLRVHILISKLIVIDKMLSTSIHLCCSDI